MTITDDETVIADEVVTDPGSLFGEDETPDFDIPEQPFMMVVEEGETVCPVADCGRNFKTTGGLRRHLTTIHGAAPSSGMGDKKPSTRRAPKTDLAHDLSQMFAVLGMTVGMANQYDGMVIMSNAERMAEAWATLASQNETVDRILRGAVAGSAFGAVAMSMVPVAVAIMANHGMVDPRMAQMLGAPPIDNGE